MRKLILSLIWAASFAFGAGAVYRSHVYREAAAQPTPPVWHPSCAKLTTLYADERCPYVFVGCTVNGDNQWVDAKTQKPIS